MAKITKDTKIPANYPSHDDTSMSPEGGVPVSVASDPDTEYYFEGGERVINKKDTEKLDDLVAKYRKAIGIKRSALAESIASTYIKAKNLGDKNTKEQGKKEAQSGMVIDPAGAMDLGMANEAMQAAQQPLPGFNWSRSSDYGQYMGNLKAGAQYGLSPEAKAIAVKGIEKTYDFQRQQLSEAGYSPSQQIAMGAQMAEQMYDKKSELAMLEDAAMLEKQAMFGTELAEDYSRQKALYDMDRISAEKTKEAAALAAQTSIENFLERYQYNKAYGPGSPYARLQEAYIQESHTQAEINNALKDYYREHGLFPNAKINETEEEKTLLNNIATNPNYVVTENDKILLQEWYGKYNKFKLNTGFTFNK